MITVHDRATTTFTTTGLGVLDREIINPIVTEELGGEFLLTFTYLADGPAAEHLTLENIVAAPVPGLKLRQGFRISEVVTTLEGMLEVSAFHVFYDLAANLIADTYVVNKTATGALTQILGAANASHGFTATSSDTVTRSSARMVRMPIAAALMDTSEDNTFVSRWGGEIMRDNWLIHHTPMRGADHGVVIRDRKNLAGFESAIDFSTVATKILPVGYDGLLLPELYVDSPKISSYVVPRIRVIRYGQVKAITDKANPREGELPLDQAYGELRRLAAAEFSAKHVDEPSASYKVRFVDLATTCEYADLAQLESVEIGDTVTVRHSDLGIALSARVVAYEYNPLSRHYISVELGSVARRFTSVTGQVKSAMSAALQASDAAGFALASADGKNTNYYATTQPEKAHLGDTWFKSSGETTEIWIYRVTDTGQPGWVALATDLNHAQISAELDAARREVEDVKAQTIRVDSAMSMLSGRLEEANTALMQARSDAQAARDTAAEVNQFATKIATVVDQHTTDLQAVKDVAQRARLTATKVEDTAKQIDTKLKQASTEIAQTKQAVTQASTNISNAHKRADDAYMLASGRPSTAQVNTLIAASANTKNTITYSSNPPSGFGSRIGDTWWQQTGGQLRGQWQWEGKTWVQRKLRHEIIASVDTATLVAGSARMGKAVVERIVGDAAFFGVLAANRIVVGDGTNLWGDPYFYASYPGWMSTDGKLSRKATGTQSGTYFTHTVIEVRPGDKFVGSFRFSRSDGAQQIVLHAQRQLASTGEWKYWGPLAATTKNSEATTSVPLTVPADTAKVRFGLFVEAATVTGADVAVWDVQIRRQTPATLIEDGAITTAKIAANTITAINIQAGAVTSDKLSIANGFITNAMIANAAINDAKIANLSASKITAGTLNAARIAAGSITSDKLTIASGFITNAMIANAAINDAKIANVSASKITAGFLAADRIAAGSVTSDKLTIASGFIKTAMIANGAITDAKIGNLSATKITTGTLSAARIAAGSITSDKLTIANGFIQSAMIKDAAVTSAKIASLDAGQITTGYLNAGRIAARSITADKLATNAIQVGLAGWTNSIRISPTQISWYNGSTLEGKITSAGMQFWYGTRYIGEFARRAHKDKPNVQGIVNQLAYRGDYVAWTYQNTNGGDYYTCLTLDPKGLFYGKAGIHLGSDLRTGGYKFYTTGSRYVTLQDCTLAGKGTHPGWVGQTGNSKIVFHTYDVMVVTNGSYYNMTRLFERTKDLMSRMNAILSLLNQGWIKSISGSGSNITWQYFSTTGLSAMSTTLA